MVKGSRKGFRIQSTTHIILPLSSLPEAPITNVCPGMSEMVTYLPISSPFIRFAGRWVDDAFGFAAGYNFFIFEAALVPFEIVACNVIIQFWTDSMPAGATIAIVIAIYA